VNVPVLAGIFGAWAAAQTAMGLLFASAWLTRRREREFWLFALLCLALATMDVGFAATYHARRMEDWVLAANFVNAAAAGAVPLGLHFAWALATGERAPRRFLLGVYVPGVAFLVAAATDHWMLHDTLRVVVTRHFGLEVQQVLGRPTWIGTLFYALLLPAYGWIVHILWGAKRRGRRESRGVLVAVLLASLFVVNDLLVAVAQLPTTYLTPFGFLMYGFGFAFSLLDRYQRAASDLEVTASELRNATDELTISYVELSNMQEELFRRRQLASVGELAGTIAHEVRNPLAVIRNAVASLRRRAANPEDRETLLAIVEEEIDRLNGLVTELLRFARPVDVERADVSIREIVDAMQGDLSEGYRLTYVVADPRADTVWADPTLLRLALDNLVSNAVQAMPGGGEIRIEASVEEVEGGGAVSRIEITDPGSGMSPTTLKRAFDPFYTTQPKGTGLGLPIVRRIIEAHEGRAIVESLPGSGTTVSVLLPLRLDALGRISTLPR
jgi:signal transduction histidine kinase